MKITNFMNQMKINPEIIDVSLTANLFQEEMQNGLTGSPSSLKMIPAYIGSTFYAKPGEYVIAIDAGGTNLRISLLQFNENSLPKIITINRYSMPGVKTPVTCDEFFDFLAHHTAEFLSKTTRIGFCFSYAVEILPSGDGRILSLGKEVTITNCTGKEIGKEFSKALKRNHLPSFTQITVVNDTTAALIGGKCLCHARNYSDYIGFILGTGTNICYYEQNRKITKNPYLSQKDGFSIVNMESAFFDRQIRGILDLEFWSQTQEPHEQHLEKMISGQYLGPLLETYLKKAAEANVFSPIATQQISALTGLTTKDLSIFLKDSSASTPLSFLNELNEKDFYAVSILINALLDRAARLVCATILGCVKQTGSGRDKNHPVLVLMEGSTYAKFTQLKETILNYVTEIIEKEHGFYIDLEQLDDAVTFGTAYAGVHKIDLCN